MDARASRHGGSVTFVDHTADVPHAYINPASEECWLGLVMTYRGAEPA